MRCVGLNLPVALGDWDCQIRFASETYAIHPAIQQALANSFDPHMQELAARRMINEAFGDSPARPAASKINFLAV